MGEYGGTYRYGDVYVFEIDKSFRLVAAQLQASAPSFKDLCGDHRLELVCTDQSCLAEFKFYPPMIFRITRHGFQLAPDLMSRQIVPTSRQLRKAARKLREDAERGSSQSWWELATGYTMDCLIHCGRSDLAWDFFYRAWPSTWKDKDTWRHNCQTRIKSSPYYRILQQLEHLPHRPLLKKATWNLPLD